MEDSIIRGMSYEYEIFVSYRRSPTVGQWVQNHFVPRLEGRLGDVSPNPVRVFCDFKMAEGVNWPAELKHRVRSSGLLLTVWSADYFRSTWCMAEWQSFRKREGLLGLFTDEHTLGLVYPVRYADGIHFHTDARQTLCRKDFSNLNYPDDVFRVSAKYLDFDNLVQSVAADLVDRLVALPAWRKDFPIVEPVPLPPARIDRPVI